MENHFTRRGKKERKNSHVRLKLLFTTRSKDLSDMVTKRNTDPDKLWYNAV